VAGSPQVWKMLACGVGSFAMDNPNNGDSYLRFARRSEMESTCMSCFLTIHADRYAPLEEFEDIHADACLAKQDSQVAYAGF